MYKWKNIKWLNFWGNRFCKIETIKDKKFRLKNRNS